MKKINNGKFKKFTIAGNIVCNLKVLLNFFFLNTKLNIKKENGNIVCKEII